MLRCQSANVNALLRNVINREWLLTGLKNRHAGQAREMGIRGDQFCPMSLRCCVDDRVCHGTERATK